MQTRRDSIGNISRVPSLFCIFLKGANLPHFLSFDIFFIESHKRLSHREPHRCVHFIAQMSSAPASSSKATALIVNKGGLVWVDEHTTLVENGKTLNPFPKSGVVDDTGKFREPTQKEVEDMELSEALRTEALDVKSPVSLRPDNTGCILVFIGRGSAALPKGATFQPGSVTALTESDLKIDPFVTNGTINGMPVDMNNGVVCGMVTGESGVFRMRGQTKVYRVVYNYGYAPVGSSKINVDGTVYHLE